MNTEPTKNEQHLVKQTKLIMGPKFDHNNAGKQPMCEGVLISISPIWIHNDIQVANTYIITTNITPQQRSVTNRPHNFSNVLSTKILAI